MYYSAESYPIKKKKRKVSKEKGISYGTNKSDWSYEVEDHSQEPEVLSNDLLKNTADRAFRIPVFLSHPSELNTNQSRFLNRLIEEIENSLLFPRTLPDTEQYPTKTLTSIRRMILSSYGLIAVNMQQVFANYTMRNIPDGTLPLPSWEGAPSLQIEPSMAYQQGLPLLLIKESGVNSIGVWNPGLTPFFIIEWDSTKPLNDFFDRVEWKEIFLNWVSQVRNGYFNQTEPKFRYGSSNI